MARRGRLELAEVGNNLRRRSSSAAMRQEDEQGRIVPTARTRVAQPPGSGTMTGAPRPAHANSPISEAARNAERRTEQYVSHGALAEE